MMRRAANVDASIAHCVEQWKLAETHSGERGDFGFDFEADVVTGIE